MSARAILTACAFFVVLSGARGQGDRTTREMIQAANDLYRQQQYEQAEQQYNQVLDRDHANNLARYNLASTLYQRGKREDAIKLFQELATTDGVEPSIRSRAYYNAGVALTRQNQLEDAVEAYKNCLRLNPEDTEARENLQKALLELRKHTPPKKPQEDEKKKKQQQQQKKQQQQSQPKMDPREAEQRLKLMEQKEKEVLQRMQSEKAKSGNALPKDW